jgi:hypothetical protein
VSRRPFVVTATAYLCEGAQRVSSAVQPEDNPLGPAIRQDFVDEIMQDNTHAEDAMVRS